MSTSYSVFNTLIAKIGMEVKTLTSDIVQPPSPRQGDEDVLFGLPTSFNVELINGPFLSDIYDGWCLDSDVFTALNSVIDVNVYSSYGDIPAGPLPNNVTQTVPNPPPADPNEYLLNSLQEVNWIINEIVGPGNISVIDDRSYYQYTDPLDPSGQQYHFTLGDIQRAIWGLTGSRKFADSLITGPAPRTDTTNPGWDPIRVNRLINLASANGSDFLAQSGDIIGVIVDPLPGEPGQQPAIIHVKTAGLGDFVWNDADCDGLQDAGEQGIAGVTVRLYADLNGNRRIDTEEGFPVDPADPEDELVGITTTDAEGFYHFGPLLPGSYWIKFETPDGFTPTEQYDGTLNANNPNFEIDSNFNPSTGITERITLAPGQINNTIDAGYCPVVELAKLGDFVWNDLNANGIQDPGEPGIGGVTVKLLTAGADGNFGTADDVIVQQQNTDTSGMYMFSGLTPGVGYRVMFNNPDTVGPDAYMFSLRYAPTGTLPAQNPATDSNADPNPGVNFGMSETVILAPGEYNQTIDAGLFRKGSIHAFGFLDVDGDGVLDRNEGAFPNDPGKTIELLNSSGQVISTQTTMNGEVWFDGLTPGEYTLKENPIPAGYTLTTPQSVTVTVNSGQELAYKRGAAMLPPGDGRTEVVHPFLVFGNAPNPAKLGNFVWNDLNANGIQDPGEPGIRGVTVKLLTAGADGNFGTADDVIAQTQTTDATGMYMFSGLTPGVGYRVMFNNPDTVGPDAYMFSPRYAPTGTLPAQNPATDSNADPNPGVNFGMSETVILAPGEYNQTIDAGLFRKGSIHVFGFLDEDGDGIQDPNEGAFPNTPGKTFQLLDVSGTVINTQTTVDGMAWFDQLTPGTYTVRENPIPDGFSLTTTPNARTFTIISGQELVYEKGAAMLPRGDRRFETNLGDQLRWGNAPKSQPGLYRGLRLERPQCQRHSGSQ